MKKYYIFKSNIPFLLKTLISISVISLLTTSCGTKIYTSWENAKRACEKWAQKGERIFTASSRPIKPYSSLENEIKYGYGRTFATDSIAMNGEPIVATFFPILLRRCEFDYDTSAYFGYQHQGVEKISLDSFPKKPNGTYWVDREGKRLKLFKSWNMKNGKKVKSYKF